MSQVLLENSKAGFILVMGVKSALFESPPQISVGWVTQDPLLNITIHKKVCNMGLKSGYTELSEYNIALDFKNTTFLQPTFSPKNRLNMF